MQIHRLLSCIVIVLSVGCSAPEEVRLQRDEISSTAQNEALIRQVLELIDERKLDAAMELYAEDYIYHGPGGIELRGREAIRGLWIDFLNGLPDLSATVEDIIIQGDKIVLRWTIRGTHTGEFLGFPASNNEITLPITEIFRVADGQLAEAWDQWGHKYLDEQLGANPE